MTKEDDKKDRSTEARVPNLGEIGLNQFAPYMLNRLANRWNEELQDLLKGLELTVTNFRALAVLMVAPGITVNELSMFAVTEQSTISRSLDALEKGGLIERKSRPSDMRIREVYISNKGISQFSSIWPAVYQLYMKIFAGIDDNEFRAFNLTLSKILANLEKTKPPASL